MLRKGIAVQTTALMIIGVLAAGVATIAVGGPIQETLMEGGDRTDDAANQFTGKIEIKSVPPYEPEGRLSQAAKFVYDRAKGCENVGEYPTLEGTVYTSQPSCGGFESPNPGKAAEGSANDFEGWPGSIPFRVTTPEPIVLHTKGKEADTWLENNLLAASQQGFNEKVNTECTREIINELKNQGYSSSDSTGWVGTSKYNIFFQPSDAGGRANPWMEDFEPTEISVYCGSGPMVDYVFNGKSGSNPAFNDRKTKVKLCQGDEGYIQVNKGDPHQEGEAGRSIIWGSDSYPFIEITKLGDSDCERISSEPPRLTQVNTGRKDSSDIDKDYITVDVTIHNRRLNSKKFEIRLDKHPGHEPAPSNPVEQNWNVKEVTIDSEKAEGSDGKKTVRMEDYQAFEWACDSTSETSTIKLEVKEVDGDWSAERDVDISHLVDKCGGSYIPRGELRDVVYVKKGKPLPLIGAKKLMIRAEILNPTVDEGRFHLKIEDKVNTNTAFQKVNHGQREQVTAHSPSPEDASKHWCKVDLVLYRGDGNGNPDIEMDRIEDIDVSDTIACTER